VDKIHSPSQRRLRFQYTPSPSSPLSGLSASALALEHSSAHPTSQGWRNKFAKEGIYVVPQQTLILQAEINQPKRSISRSKINLCDPTTSCFLTRTQLDDDTPRCLLLPRPFQDHTKAPSGSFNLFPRKDKHQQIQGTSSATHLKKPPFTLRSPCPSVG